MKLLVGLAAVVASQIAFSQGAEVYNLKGMGTWKTKEGKGGHYSVNMRIEKAANGSMHIAETYSFNNTTKVISYDIVNKDHGYYDIQAEDGAKIGEGYCFASAHGSKKTCHAEVQLPNGDRGDRSFHVDLKAKRVYRIGHAHHASMDIAWTDKLYFTTPWPH